MRTRPALVLLLVLALVGVAIPVVHAHQAGTPGIYNEECSLERLAAGLGGATLAATPTALQALVDVPAPPVPESPAPSPLPALPVGARAPPAAS